MITRASDAAAEHPDAAADDARSAGDVAAPSSGAATGTIDPSDPAPTPDGHPVPAPEAGPVGPIEHRYRSLAPDFARGLMLLLIALANVWSHLYGQKIGIGYRPVDGSTADRVVDGLVSFVADDRARPMFAILYGYGIATMSARMGARGVAQRGVRRVLARRSLWLIVLGLAHGALLYFGDVLALYGATGLIALVLVHRSRAVLLRWFWVSFGLMLAADTVMAAGLFGPGDGEAHVPPADYPATVLENLTESGVNLVLATASLYVLSQVVLGFLVQRWGWLDRPWDHRATLTRVFWLAAAVNLVANLPNALAVARLWTPTGAGYVAVDLMHGASGVLMGLGYVCLFALVAARLREAGRTGVVAAVAAVGERSLTCYLMQSMMLVPLFGRWCLGLGDQVGTAVATAISAGAWGVTLVVAAAMDRRGRRGPFEVVLRRLTYGPRRAVTGG